MKVKPIYDPLDDERVIGVHPRMEPEVEVDWKRRLNLYKGRSLSDVALTVEQEGRGGQLSLRGQMVSPGTIFGLEAGLEQLSGNGNRGNAQLHVAAGVGMTVYGEDVVIPLPMRVDVMSIPVYAPIDLLEGNGEGSRPAPTRPLRGFLKPRRLGPSLKELIADGVQLPLAGILVIQPTEIGMIGEFDLTDPCEERPEDYAFQDHQIVDACRLILYTWPTEWLLLPFRGVYWRNRMAYTIFEAERKLRAGEVLPWVEVGVPIGLIGFNRSWAPQFVDRYSVVRAGGKPKTRTPIVSDAGSPFLWQARMQQFSEQLAHEDPVNTPILQLAKQFRYLPPAGLIPKNAIDPKTGTQHFFPAHYDLDAVPVPLEQLDLALESSAPLAPYDITVRDSIRVLVPVPQVYFEPELLAEEVISPEFQETIDEFIERRGKWLSRRVDVREMFKALVRAIRGEEPEFPDPDPNALEEEPIAEDPIDLDDPELQKEEGEYGTEKSNGNCVGTAAETLCAELDGHAYLREDEVSQLDVLGLVKFIDFLDQRIARADDKIDLGFIRAQTDIYRVRQLMLSNVAASRLATSPVLATIAQGETAIATKQGIDQYLATLKSTKNVIKPQAHNPSSGGNPTGSAQPSSSELGLGSSSLHSNPGNPGPVDFGTPGGIADVFDMFDGVGEQLHFTSAGSGKLFGTKATTAKDIFGQAPVVGKAYDFRNLTVAQRLEDSPALEVKTYAVATMAEVYTSLANLEIGVDDIQVRVSIVADKNGIIDRADTTLSTLGNIQGKDIWGILKIPDPQNGDEAMFFSLAVDILEQTIAGIRRVEGRVHLYRQVVERCRKTLAVIEEFVRSANSRLGLIEEEVAEARHDVAVARALLAEETQRVEGVNARRKEILEEHVDFFAYHRPRIADTLEDMPTRILDPGLVEDPVPACLASTRSIPPDLQSMVDLFREVPLKWLRFVPRLLDRLDRLDVLHSTIHTAVQRSKTKYLNNPVRPLSMASSKLGHSIGKVFSAQKRVVSGHRMATAQLNFASLAGLSWRQTRDKAEKTLSLSDLMDAGQLHSEVARRASKELGDIGRVATCLYIAFGEVKPSLRLDWAERLSQYDDPINLRNLLSLPRWDELEYLDRKEMQASVDWLYQRVDAQETEAVSLISDLVRICILLASHAPVRRIIAGHVNETTTVSSGGRVNIVVDPNVVRVGMRVLMYAGNNVVAQGVVEDLSAGLAVARVLEASAPTVNLEEGAKVQFGEETTLLLNPFVGAWS